MPPKKKSNKKAAADDWESELGETVDPTAAAKEEEEDGHVEDHVNGDADSGGMGGGLLAALKKNKTRKAKKGKAVLEDFVEGEDPIAAENETDQEPVSKAPVEADADDVFGTQPTKEKGKTGKGAKQQNAPVKQATEHDEEEDEGDGGGGGLKSKKEKEREKKEREKQRKKEQVGSFHFLRMQLLMVYRQQRRRPLHQYHRRKK